MSTTRRLLETDGDDDDVLVAGATGQRRYDSLPASSAPSVVSTGSRRTRRAAQRKPRLTEPQRGHCVTVLATSCCPKLRPCSNSRFLCWGSFLTERMTRKDPRGSQSLNAKERCFNASFQISFSIGYLGPSFRKGKEIVASHRRPTDDKVKGHRCMVLHNKSILSSAAGHHD